MTTNTTQTLTDAQKWALLQDVTSTWGLSDEFRVLVSGLMARALAKDKDIQPIQKAVIEMRNANGAKLTTSNATREARRNLEGAEVDDNYADSDVARAERLIHSMVENDEAVATSDHVDVVEEVVEAEPAPRNGERR